MQIERLVQMVFYLLDCGHVTAKELAAYFHVSTKTIYRDINTLTLAGIPILSTKGTGGGISLIAGYTLDKSFLSEAEQQQIYQGLQILQAANYPHAEMALSKIGAVFRTVLTPNWLDVDLTYWGSPKTEKLKMSELQYAILNKYRISFHYSNSELKQSQRIIEPLQIAFKSHAWYIVGYCLSKQEIRIFRLSRIKQLQVLPELFERTLPPDYSFVSENNRPCDSPFLTLRFSPEIAHRVYDEFQEDQLTIDENGYYLTTVQYELNNWTVHYLLSFGKYVEIIEPQAARELLKERALEIVELYKDE